MMFSGRELAGFGFSPVDRELFFVIEHPAFKNLTPYLRGTYESCCANVLDNRIPELDEAYIHVFVTDGGCDQCKTRFEGLAAPLMALLEM